jgi:CheY-like chemotaxis protein
MENTNSSKPNPGAESQKTILVVDDNEMISLLIKSILEEKYKIVLKSDGQDALAYLSQGNRPHLILLDMLMPNMNGRTFVRRVFTDPRYGKIPIIFITTVDSSMLINSFKAMGVVDYIIKPVIKEDLITRVEKILKP